MSIDDLAHGLVRGHHSSARLGGRYDLSKLNKAPKKNFHLSYDHLNALMIQNCAYKYPLDEEDRKVFFHHETICESVG